MIVKEIIVNYLKDNGFDGLYTEDCGCTAEDLAPCDSTCMDCIPGIKIDPPPEEYEGVGVWIGPKHGT